MGQSCRWGSVLAELCFVPALSTVMLWEHGDPKPNAGPPPTAGEMLSVAEHFLEQQMHPTVIIGAYRKALDDMIHVLKKIRSVHLGQGTAECCGVHKCVGPNGMHPWVLRELAEAAQPLW